MTDDDRKLARLRREIEIGLEAAREGRFSKRTVDEIFDEVRRGNGLEVSDIERLQQAVHVGIDDWQAGRVDDRPIEEILDEIEGEDER